MNEYFVYLEVSYGEVVASNYGEAIEHKSLPKLGEIRDGWKLKAKYARCVQSYRRWYLVELEWTRWKYRFFDFRPKRIKRWVKSIWIDEAKSK